MISSTVMLKSSQKTVKSISFNFVIMENKDDDARRNQAKKQFQKLGEHLELVKNQCKGKQTEFFLF